MFHLLPSACHCDKEFYTLSFSENIAKVLGLSSPLYLKLKKKLKNVTVNMKITFPLFPSLKATSENLTKFGVLFLSRGYPPPFC